MPYPLKYNTASQNVTIGYALDSTDGDTEEIALTIANTDIKLHKAGATTLANKNLGGATHISNGIYYLTLDATDTNTYGPLDIYVHVAGALAMKKECIVMNAVAYDSLYGTDNLDVNAIQFAGTAYSTALAAEVDAIWDEALTGATHNVSTSAGKRLRQIDAAFEVHSGTAQAGTANTITLDAGASATNDIYRGDRAVITGGTGQGEHGIIISYNGTTKVATMSENWVITPDVTSEFEIVPADTDIETWNHTVVSSGATSGYPVVDAQAISDSTTAANNVETNITNLDAQISVVDTVADSILVDTGTTIPAQIAALNDPTAAAIAAAVYTYNMGNSRTIGEALAFLRNKWAISGSTLTVYDTDDTTVLWTSTVATTAGDPVSSSDPV